MREEFSLVALGYENEDLTAAAFKELQTENEKKGDIISSGIASSVLSLLSNAESFIVKKDGKKTVIAGVPLVWGMGERRHDSPARAHAYKGTAG